MKKEIKKKKKQLIPYPRQISSCKND